LFLLFDHVTATQDDVTIKNIFSSISTDDGASFGAASARTNYTAFGSNGLDPIIIQKSNGTAWLIFYENKRVLHLDETANGFLECSNCGSLANHTMGVKTMHLDSSNQKIYVAYGNSNFAIKCVSGVAVVDKATWSIDKVYYNNSTPALNGIFCNSHVWNNSHIHGDGKYFALCVPAGNGHTVVAVIDHTADSITHYMIDDLSYTRYGPTDGLPAWSLPRNVSHNSNARYGFLGIGVKCIRVDASRDRIYMGWDGGFYRQYYMFSYIDLTEAPDGEGFYDMSWVTSETSGIAPANKVRVQFEYGWEFEFDLERGYIITICPSGSLTGTPSWNGVTLVLSEAADGAIVKQYDINTNNSAPRWGPYRAVVYGGCVYGDVPYYSAFPHTDQRGLCKIDYVNDVITYYRPTFATANNYGLRGFAVDEENDRIYIACSYGIARFDIVSGAWTLFNDDTLPGFVRSGEVNSMGFVDFDPTSGDVLMGSWNDYVNDYLSGIGMFNENGAYNQLQYVTANKTTSWDWLSQLDLSHYSTELKPSATVTPDDTLWVTWSHIDYEAAQSVLYWDNDLGDINVVNDITGSVVVNWRVKRVNQLEFRLANGHLYDPQNLLSTKNVVGQKGRKVHLRFGEHIGGYVYWVNQGTFIVDTIRMSYKRGDDPVLNISCTGITAIWRQKQVAVSTLYSGTMPDNLINDLLDDHTSLVSTDYDLPTFDNEHSIYYQWIDKSLWDIIEELCDHFFYAMYEDVDGVFTCRQVSLTQSVDHEYTDQMQLVNFSPDDNYSNYTNRVRVIGESNDYTEVLHAEELITSRAGTIGWWAKEDTEKIHFSEDDSRQCRNPRLEITHSPKEYGLLLDQLASGHGGIEISYIDPYEKFIRVTVRVKDLTAAFVGAVIAMVAAGMMAMGCIFCGPFIVALAITASLVFYILAAMAQYAYEVYARPLGRVKTTIQYVADDIEFQQKLNGEIITEEITDALCNSVAECRRVAEGNLAMIKAQRSRISFSKLCHLEDELLDKLKVYHPYSGEGMEVLVVGLKRTYVKGQNVIDDIEGWRYIP
jgi:hypothetical protein